MRLVTSTCVYPVGSDPFFALRSVKAHGFDAADMALDYYQETAANHFEEDDWLDNVLRLRELADELELPITHAHSPHNFRCMDDPREARNLRRAVQAAQILGAKYLVVHPCQIDEHDRPIIDPGEFVRVNRVYTDMLLEEAVKRGVILLSENLLWDATIDPVNIALAVKEIDSPYYGWCWDIGHSHLMGIEPERVKACAVPPASLHIQDNHRLGDEHLIPTDGTVDWPRVFGVLKDVGYAGDFVLEAHHQSCEAKSQEERDAILDKLERVSRRLMNTYF